MDTKEPSWDYRVLKFDKESGRPDVQGYCIHEVFYNPKQRPESFNSTPLVLADLNIQDLAKMYNKIQEGLQKPVLLVRDRRLIETQEIAFKSA